MTGPASPQRVLADQLPGTAEERMRVASDQLVALAEAGYAVVSVIDPDDEPDRLPVGTRVRTTDEWMAKYGQGRRLTGGVKAVRDVGVLPTNPERTHTVLLDVTTRWSPSVECLTFDPADLEPEEQA